MYEIQDLTGSQWKWMRVGMICCQGLVLVRTLAAEFCKYWSLSRTLLGTTDRTLYGIFQIHTQIFSLTCPIGFHGRIVVWHWEFVVHISIHCFGWTTHGTGPPGCQRIFYTVIIWIWFHMQKPLLQIFGHDFKWQNRTLIVLSTIQNKKLLQLTHKLVICE